MGNTLFGLDISKLIGDALGGELLSGAWQKQTPGTRTADNLTGGTNPSSTNYTFKGIVEKFEHHQVDGTLVRQHDLRILILENTISPATTDDPKPSDRITIEGRKFVVADLGVIERDPAEATFIVHVRGLIS